jgi:CheY-like chemotaxis protein
VSTKLVLVVDDEERILASLKRSLRREGYRLLTALGPQQALRHLQDEPVDLIVSDHRMPGMSGLELLSRAAQIRPQAIRMLITGWAEAVSDEQIEALEIQAIIPKPWEDADLKNTLRKALG